MPSGPRLDTLGILQHVCLRGVERRVLFMDDSDRRDFCARLERVCGQGAAEVLAWCLMPNHVHLAIRSVQKPLHHTMRRLLTGYALRFNERHNRAGHLFQNRYKSKVVASERYLLSLVRYIHLNPVRAGIVASIDELESYEWCGFGALVGQTTRSFQTVAEILGRFGPDLPRSRHGLRMFMRDLSTAQQESSTFEFANPSSRAPMTMTMRRRRAVVAEDPGQHVKSGALYK